MTIEQAKKIMGSNFIGPTELSTISSKLHLGSIAQAPEVHFSEDDLNTHRNTHILIFGVSRDDKNQPLTINHFRELFGTDPAQSEPCMYNQDWYLKEKFANESTLENKWYLIAKKVLENSRAVMPKDIQQGFSKDQKFPSAILTVFTFFAYYFLNGGDLLWKHDFLWCDDTDANGDRIYTGRYVDPRGLNKNGFNIHRHLSLKPNYASAPEVK